MRRVVPVVLLLPLLASCSGTVTSPRPPEAPVSAMEASAVLRQVAHLAAQRTSDAASRVCNFLAESCGGMSGGFRADPVSAPKSPPSIVCDIALPPISGQAGAQVLVVTGRDASGRSYVGQVLVMRRLGRPVLHEPAFWLGIRYTQLVRGMAWDGSGDDPSLRAAHDVAVRKACADPAAFIAAVIPAAKPSP